MQRRSKSPILGAFLFVVLFDCLATNARCQSLDSILNDTDKANLAVLVTQTAQKIINADRTEKEPKVLVIDFFLGSPGTSSNLGSLLADRFAKALRNSSSKIRVLDRKMFGDYLTKNWTTLEDLRNNKHCLIVGRALGATGVVLGTVYEENGLIAVKTHLAGFGLSDEQSEGPGDLDEFARLTATQQTKEFLYQRGPNYAREPETLPDETGVLRAGVSGAGMPSCTHCPNPVYPDVARAAKVQGTVVLGVVITAEGKTGTIHVLKAAPFGLTAQAIKAVQQWKFKPAQKEDGTPVNVATPVEVTYRLF
jgi:TonB family protein